MECNWLKKKATRLKSNRPTDLHSDVWPSKKTKLNIELTGKQIRQALKQGAN